MATWAPIVFWILLVPLIIVLLIVYLKGKKTYRLAYILSIFTYAMTIMYWIDSYQLNRNAIIVLLVISSLLMILIGRLIGKQKRRKSMKNMKFALLDVILILLIVAVSASGIGLNVETHPVASVLLKDIVIVRQEGDAQYQPPAIPIYTVTVTNKFIPRQYELPIATACLYNSEKKASSYLDVRWDVQEQASQLGMSTTALEVYRESKTATLKAYPGVRYKGMPQPVTEKLSTEIETYDQIYLFLRDASKSYTYIDCFNADFTQAIKIPVTP